MNVFAERYLEAHTPQHPIPLEQWKWTPASLKIGEIYASGAKTATRSSTYAAERDDNSDTDRPNEGD